MIINVLKHKPVLLFLFLACFFVTNALIAEFIGVKIFSLEKTIGINPITFTLFGQEGLSFNLTAGVLLWPFVFIITDLINEYYGVKGVKIISYFTAVLISYAFAMFYIGMGLHPADFWISTKAAQGTADMNLAFNHIFGQGLWIIVGSLVAFLIGQIVDAKIFHKIKLVSKSNKNIWLRATISTLISQFIDSFVVLFIAFYIGQKWSFALVLAICLVNYLYKFVSAIAMLPILYAIHFVIEAFLGKELASAMKQQAIES